jgi:hypothetical protein
LIAVLVMTMLPVEAQAMSVAEFLAKAERLKARGFLAIGSPDLKLLMAEMKAVGSAYRADAEGARAAGRAPHSCPPPKGSKQARMGSEDFLKELRATPPADRERTSMKDAFYAIMKRRFPC